jgi:hypothetical protein
MVMIALATGAFLVWAVVGVKMMAGTWHAFGWLDREAVGTRFWVVGSGVAFVLASAVVYGFWVLVVWARSQIDDVIGQECDDEAHEEGDED